MKYHKEMKELNIPAEHIEKFRFFINLPDELKEKIFSILKEVPVGTSPDALLKSSSERIKNLSQEWHIERVKKQLETIFPKQNGKGSITLLGNNLIDKIDERCLHNAEIITNETLF